MKVLIGGEKGGSSKSTNATNLAVYLAHQGVDVVLLDADPQGTSARFVERRNEYNPALPVVHCVQRSGDVSATIKDLILRYQVVIIDAGGRDSKELRTAMVVADVFITPIRASQADLETLPHVNELIALARSLNPSLEAYALLSLAPSNPMIKEVPEAQEMISQFDQLKLANSIIRDRKVYRDALAEGRGVVEMNNYLARAEIQLLGQEFFNITGNQ